MRAALAACRVAGIETNLDYLRQVIDDAAFARGGMTTALSAQLPYVRHAIDVIDAGVQTTVQDYPGRLGYWHVGVPPSGPMDALAFRAANRLVGNGDYAAGLEIAVVGPTLRFRLRYCDRADGRGFRRSAGWRTGRRWRPSRSRPVHAGDDNGARSGRARLSCDFRRHRCAGVSGKPSTFILGGFGGHAGRVLRAGDVMQSRHGPPRPRGKRRLS